MRRLYRRLPSPAVVIAMVALFVALAGAGLAASTAFVRSIKPISVVPGSVGADGSVSGAGLSGGEKSVGVYVITVRGDTFAAAPFLLWPHMRSIASARLTISGNGLTSSPSSCAVASEDLSSNGGGTVEVHCFAYDPASGWQPADTPFDLQIVGPSR